MKIVFLERKDCCVKNKNLISQSLNKKSKDYLLDSIKKPTLDLLRDTLSNPVFTAGIPITKFIFQLNDLRITWQNVSFVRKYGCFIGIIDRSFDSESLEEKLDEVCKDQKKKERIVENTIIELDRYQTIQKAKLLGYLFDETFKKKHFTIDEYHSLIYGIDFLHPTQGIDCLKRFFDNAVQIEENRVNEEEVNNLLLESSNIDFSPIIQSGLLILPNGGCFLGDLGGASLNPLGKRFCKYVVERYLKDCTDD